MARLKICPGVKKFMIFLFFFGQDENKSKMSIKILNNIENSIQPIFQKFDISKDARSTQVWLWLILSCFELNFEFPSSSIIKFIRLSNKAQNQTALPPMAAKDSKIFIRKFNWMFWCIVMFLLVCGAWFLKNSLTFSNNFEQGIDFNVIFLYLSRQI